MRCLKCWSDIREKNAIYTKSCNHVFCEECSEKAFKKELSCPLCDTVLPKDGIGDVNLRPDSSDVKKASAKVFGFEPDQMCEVLQLGLDFWANQKKNESIKHTQDMKNIRKHLSELEKQNAKMLKALEDERLKKKSLQSEKESLQRTVSELETRYAEKSRSMRKLNELYNELRQVHRRLEVDLRGVREAPDYDEGNVHQSEIEIKTIGRSNNRHARKDRENRAPERSGRDGDAAVSSARISLEGSRDITVDKKRATSRAEAPNSGTLGSSAPLETLFNLAPNHTSRSGRDVLAISKKDRNSRGRRHDRMYSVDGNTEFDDSENRLTPRLQRPHRR